MVEKGTANNLTLARGAGEKGYKDICLNGHIQKKIY
jgi:hypothetical protein